MLDLPSGAVVKNTPANAGRARDPGSTPGLKSWSRKWQPAPVFLPGKIAWAEESGGVQPMGLQRIGQD